MCNFHQKVKYLKLILIQKIIKIYDKLLFWEAGDKKSSIWANAADIRLLRPAFPEQLF